MVSAYRLEDFDWVLAAYPPPVAAPPTNGHHAPAPAGDGEAPTAAEVADALAFISPTEPEDQFWLVLVAARSACPGHDGFLVVDEWSSAARIGAGQTTHLRADPKLWERVDARVDWRHLVKRATAGGWKRHHGFTIVSAEPPPSRAEQEEEERVARETAAYPPLSRDELPAFLGLVVDHLAPTTVAWDRDWAEMLAVTALSILFPEVYYENLGVNLWFLGLAKQNLGKTRSLTEMRQVVQGVARGLGQEAKYISHATMEGYSRVLAGERKVVYADHQEYSSLLELAQRDYMSGIKGFLCSAYDGEDWTYYKSREEQLALRPYMVTVAATHQKTLARTMPLADLTNGYASRFLMCAPRYRLGRKVGYRTERERGLLVGTLVDHLRQFRSVDGERLEAGFRVPVDRPFHQPPALLAYERDLGLNQEEETWYELEDALTEEDSIETPGRSYARVLKLATILELLDLAPHVAGGAVLVRDEYFGLAVRLVARAASYARRMAEQIGLPEDAALADRIERQLKNRAKTVRGKGLAAGMTRRQLGTWLKVSAKSLDPALHMLEAAGVIEAKSHNTTHYYCWTGGKR